MTKKDYEIIAEMVSKSALVMSRLTLIDELVGIFKKDNERFNEANFRKACE